MGAQAGCGGALIEHQHPLWGVLLGRWETNYLLSSLTVGMGDLAPLSGCVCVRERDSGCLMPGALLPYSHWIRVPEFGLCGIASQTIFYRTVWSSGEDCRALPCPSCPPHSWVSAEMVLDSRTGSRGSAPGPSGTARVFLFCFAFAGIDYFFQAPVPCFRGPLVWPLSSGV